jgi:hypothetical protein
MPIVQIKDVGAIGVNSDLSAHELPPNAWTDASNVRFIDGSAHQFLGHSEVYNSPAQIPQHVLPCSISNQRYWIYTTAAKTYATTVSGGAVSTTDITHVTPRTGVVNQWTSTLLSGIPILNSGDTTNIPMYWDLNLANKFVDLPNWLPNCFAKSLRTYKNFLIALNITRPPKIAIATITRVGTTATLTTSAAHGLSSGNTVYITQASPSQYNGTFTITVTGATTFTYTMASDPGASATLISRSALYGGAGVNKPYMVKWSHPADPGSVPVSWDEQDPTREAGELDIAEGQDIIVDGMQLRDSFIIYKENSIWRMDFTGGQYVMRFSKVFGTSGALNRNCIAELDGSHCVLTGQDIIVHDGQTATSILDRQTRRFLFQNIDATNIGKCFVFKNTFFNEVFICYPTVGSSVCDKAVVWNYKDRTVTFRTLPNINHAAYGSIDTSSGTYDLDIGSFNSDITLYDGLDLVPATARVIMASNDQKLYMLDASASFNGDLPVAYLERQGLSFDAPQNIKMVRGVRLRIQGTIGETVQIQVGYSDDPFTTPTYLPAMTHIIGTTISNDCFVSGRYISIKLSTGTSYKWRLDSYDFDVVIAGQW